MNTNTSKECNKCGGVKPATAEHFYRNAEMSDGLLKQCKSCTNSTQKKSKAENRDKVLARNAIYYKKNKAKWDAYASANHEKIRARRKAYGIKNRDALNALKRSEKYRAKDRVRERERYQAEPEKHRDKCRRYRSANRHRVRERRRITYKQWLNSDSTNKLSHNVSVYMARCLSSGKGGVSWRKLVEYGIDDLKRHLEAQFADGMTWDNYGKDGWHVDHKRPVSSFKFSSPEDSDFKECWSLDNLQPLWWYDNLSKKNKWQAVA